MAATIVALVAASTPVAAQDQEDESTPPDADGSSDPQPPTNIEVSDPVVPVSSPRLDSLPPAPDLPDVMSVNPPRVNPLAAEPDGGARGTWDRGDVPVDPLIQPDSGRAPSRTPAVGLSFDGTGNPTACGGCAPPDTNGDVGPNHYVQMVNATKIQIWDKAGTQLVAPIDLGTLWTTGACTANRGDPIVVYDPLADRWVLSQFQTPTQMCFAVSQTADPTGAYHLYEFNVGAFPDYFKLGVWPDAYYMSANEASYTAYAFDRTQMLTGAAATFQKVSPAATNLLLPSDMDGPTPPPAGTPNHFYTFKDNTFHGGGGDRIEVYDYHVDFATPANSTFGLVASIPIAAFTYTACGFFNLNCIPQGGTAQTVDQIGDWPMWRLPYRNFGTHETMVGTFSIGGGTGTAGSAIRWFELRRTGGAWTLFQEGTHDLGDGLDRWMGSIAMDSAGNMALGYSTSSPTTFPDIRYVTRLAGDPLGTLGAEVVMQAGGGSQTGSSRWGDYSAMTVDPSDECTFWYTTEYYAASSGSTWSTRVGNFKEPTCGAPPAGNDAFSSAATIGGPADTKTGSNVGFTVEAGEPDPTCGDLGTGSSETAWWNWTAPATGNATIDTFGSNFDTVLAAYTGGAVNALTEVACNDDAVGLQSEVTFPATAGTTYRVQVDGFNGTTGNITLNTTGCLGLNNDAFACADTIGGPPDTKTGSNVGYSVEAGEPDPSCGDVTGSSETAWWNWTAPATGNVTIDTFGSNFDTVLTAYTGAAVNALTEVACNDDAAATLQSEVTFAATAGTTYRVQVDGWSGATGNITLNTSNGTTLLCNGLAVTVDIGAGDPPTAGPDVIRGTNGPDNIDGLAGDDTICGLDGDDVLAGGTGNDTILGEGGNDTLKGQQNNDTLMGGLGSDLILGNAGDDVGFGGAGIDDLKGGSGVDTLDGGADDDEVRGGSGNDTLTGGIDNDVLNGGQDFDTVSGGIGDDIVNGAGSSDPSLNGDDGDDLVRGGNGGDTLNGGIGNDQLLGVLGADTLNGGPGNDDLRGGDGNDDVNGDAGDDDLRGGNGTDDCDGGIGFDQDLGGCETTTNIP